MAYVTGMADKGVRPSLNAPTQKMTRAGKGDSACAESLLKPARACADGDHGGAEGALADAPAGLEQLGH